MLCICFVLAPLDNHEIAFGYESFTDARHLRAVSLVSRHFPPLHGALRSSTAALVALPSHPLNRECHPPWHLRRLASRRYASHRNPTASAQAVCHPLSGGSVACLVSACASLHAGDRALCAVIAFQCFAVQLIAVQCLPIRFALRFEIAFSLCKARPDRQVLHTIGASDKACADSQKGSDRRIARADEEYHPRGRRR